jgi:hypothetical protein
MYKLSISQPQSFDWQHCNEQLHLIYEKAVPMGHRRRAPDSVGRKELTIMNNRLKRSLLAIALPFTLVVLASSGFAQWRDRADVDSLIRQAENHSSRFAATVDQLSDQDRFERMGGIDRLSAQARDLENQITVIGDDFNRGSGRFEVRERVANALNTAREINMFMNRREINYAAERQWAMLRLDLNRLATVYDLRQLS